MKWVGSMLVAALVAGCPGEDEPTWAIVENDLPGALLSVWGTSADDVWAVGGDSRDGMGPTVLHWDGTALERVATGRTSGALWWVFGFDGGPVYMGGEGGVILRRDPSGTFTQMTTPGTQTVFGIWGATPDDLWAVGGVTDTSGFAWRLDGDVWVEEPTLPVEVPGMAAVWKVFGRSADDVWLVGSNGVSLHWDGIALALEDTGVGSSLFTVHANGSRYAAVGGFPSGIIVEHYDGTWHNVTPEPLPNSFSGVFLSSDDSGVAVGIYGQVYERIGGAWRQVDTGFSLAQNLHAVWIDPSGDAWAVGGMTLSPDLPDGVLIHRGQTHPLGGP